MCAPTQNLKLQTKFASFALRRRKLTRKSFSTSFSAFSFACLANPSAGVGGAGAVRVCCVFALVIYVSSAVVVLFLFLAQKVNLTVSFVVLVQ